MKALIISDAELKAVYQRCKSLVKPTPAEAQRRGYDFERIIEYLLKDVEVQVSYRTKGEQIDGSFFYWGQTFLVEAKWQKPPIQASEIYSFKGKLDGKFHTTSGIFLSMSGYSEDTNNALRFGKEINILLFDGGDMDDMIESGIPFLEVLKYKLRQAGNTGDPYVPYRDRETAKAISSKMPIISGTTASFVHRFDTGIDLGLPGDPLFLVMTDRTVGENISEAFFKQLKLDRPVAFQFKQVKLSSYPLKTINSLASQVGVLSSQWDFRGVILLLNNDEEGEQLKQSLEKPLREMLEKNAMPMEVAVFNLDFKSLKEQHFQPVKFLPGITGIRSLIDYINTVTLDENLFYDDQAARKAVLHALETAEWDTTDKVVIFPDEYDSRRSTTIENYSQLIAHLEEVALQAGSEETPLEILKDDDERPDYSNLVGILLDDYQEKLSALGFH